LKPSGLGQAKEIKRNNSYAVKTQQPNSIQVGSTNIDLIQKRAFSVAETEGGHYVDGMSSPALKDKLSKMQHSQSI